MSGSEISCDVCVLGAGSAGLSLAAGASQMGARVVLLEGHKMGGDCLNYGCVPSKALLAAGKAAHSRRMGAAMGVAETVPDIDFAAAKDHVHRVIAAIEPHDSQERFEGLGVRVIREHGRFISDRQVQAGDTVITARRFVVATGSRPFVPPIPGLHEVPYLTNETVFDLQAPPAHLVILGGGPIGMEMAQAHRRLGCEVTVIEADKALGREDRALARCVIDALVSEGVVLHEGAVATSVEATPDGVRVMLDTGHAVAGTHLLVAAGRAANVEGLGLERAGVRHDRAGITVDARLRSSNRRVYAIGDVAGQGQFTHLAGYHASVVIRPILFGLPARARTDHVPRVTYTDPELAQIGLTEPEARARHGDRVTVVSAPYDGNDRALAEGRPVGMIKVMIVRGRPVGVSIVGAQAGELIGLWSLVIANRLKLTAVTGTVLPYPTLSEVGKRAAGAYFTPKLFDNAAVKRVVGLVQRLLP